MGGSASTTQPAGDNVLTSMLDEVDTYQLVSKEGVPASVLQERAAKPRKTALRGRLSKAVPRALRFPWARFKRLASRRSLSPLTSPGDAGFVAGQSLSVESDAMDDCAMRGCACNEGLEELVAAVVLGDKTDEEATRRICGCTCSGNTQVLCLASFLFTTITALQVIGALVAHSDALLTDAIAMAVDTVTYLLSLVAENVPQVWLKIVVPGLSMVALMYACTSALQESVPHLIGGSDDADVNPYIVLFFSAWCLLLDLVVIVAFCRNARGQKGMGTINMLAAFSHVAADLFRSGATCVESLLIMGFHVDGGKADAWATVVISVVIVLGIVYPAFEWCKSVVDVCVGKGEFSAK